MGYRHCVLRDASRTMTIFDRLKVVLAQLLEKQDLDFHYAFYRDIGRNLGEHVYMETHDRALLHLVEDFETPVRYLQVGAEDDITLDAIETILQEILDIVPLCELQEYARREMRSNPAALIRLALGAGGQSDPQTLEILVLGLRDENPKVRRLATEAASLTGWPELTSLLGPLVDRFIKTDT